MELIKAHTERIDYLHKVSHEGIEYLREETLSLNCYVWDSDPTELLDLHTIKWTVYGEDDIVEYFNKSHGWSKDGRMNKDNPVPRLEFFFKNSFNLTYF